MGQSFLQMMWPWSREKTVTAQRPDSNADAVLARPVDAPPKPAEPGRQAVLDGDWITAARIWGERALNDPKNARNHRHYIRALIRMERFHEAAAACEIARKHHRRDHEFLLRRIWLLDRLGIEDAFRKELRLPGVAEAVAASGRMALIVGRHYWRRGMLPTARKYFLMAEGDPETGTRARLHLARLDYRAGDLEQAALRWSEITDDPESPGHPEEPHLFLGRIALKLGDTETGLEPAIEDTELVEKRAEDPSRAEQESMEVVDVSDLVFAAREHLDANRLIAAKETALHALSLDEANYQACEVAGFAANRSSDWEAAVMAWSHLADLQPFRIGPLFQAASACEQMGDRTGALNFAERALALEPENETALAICARQLARSRDLAGLAAFAEKVESLGLETIPDRLVMAIADGFSSLGVPSKSASWIERAIERGASSPEIRLRQARLLYSTGNFAASAELWRELLDAPATVVRPFEPHVFLARSALRIGDTTEAVAHFREAVRLNPQHLESRDGLVSALLKHGDVHGADTANDLFRKDFPGVARPCIMHLIIGYRLMDSDDINRRYKTAIRDLGDSADDLISLGRAIDGQQDSVKALAHWKDLGARFPGNPSILQRLLNQQTSAAGQEREARQTAEELLDASPDHEIGLLQLAILNQRLGDLETAEKLYRRGISIYPANIGFWIGHGNALMRADKIAEGQSLLQQARSYIDEADPVALADLARLAELTDLPDQADSLLQSALDLAPANSQLWRRAVRFNMNRGTYGKAWDLAVKGRELDRRDPVIVEALTKSSAMLQLQDPDWHSRPISEHAGLLVPDDLFGTIAGTEWPAPASDSGPARGAMLVTSTLGSGGSERQVMFSMQALARVDHGLDDIHLVARSLNPDHAHDFFLPLVEESGYPVIDLGSREPSEFARDMGSSIIPHREALRIAAAMPQEIQAMALPLLGVFLKRRPKVVHTWQDTVNIAGGLAALLAGVPRIVMGTRSTRPDARRRMRRYLEPGYHALLALPQITMVNNSHNGARDYEDWLGLEAGTVGVVHNGFDVDEIRAAASRTIEGETPDSLGIPESTQVIGGVMRFSEEKRPELFIDAAIALAPRLPETHFLLIGEGPLRVELRKKVKDAGLSDRIHLPGAKRPVEPWMNRMSVLVLTSRMEGLPNVLIEAQILGVPVAATKVGGVPETMIEDQTGIMVDSGDPQVLADRLFDMASNRDRLQTMGKAARDWAEANFSLEGMIRNTLGFYRMPDDPSD